MASNADVKVGWQDGPNHRGTSTLVWSALSTVIACTWTILHLNVPGYPESGWVKFGRKAKWMLITILFPEFVFSRAICELQTALDDLHALKKKEDVIKWRVDFGRGLQNLHKMFHLFDTSPSSNAIDAARPGHELAVLHHAENAFPPTISSHSTGYSYDPDFLHQKERLWTLTHSYFANMGGLERYRGSEDPSSLTAHALVNCCAGSNHDPLPTLNLTKEDIEDKAKTDWFLRCIAIAQISWFLVSVITRAGEKLPISQLEICTAAFSVLAVGTYAANWSKPKDIGVAVRFKMLTETYECEAYKYHAEPFYYRLIRPSKRLLDEKVTRIRNDFVRLEGFMPPMAITMAISTAIFGGLHCLAWNFEFPTEIELTIWMIFSVASATIPTAALIANMMVIRSIHRAIRKCSQEFSNGFKKWEKDAGQGDKPLLTRRQKMKFTPQQCSRSPKIGISKEDLTKKLLTLQNGLNNYMLLGIQHRKVFASYEVAFRIWHQRDHFVYNREKDQLDNEIKSKLLAIGTTPTEAEHLIYLIQDPRIMKDEKEKLEKIISPRDTISSIITIIGGTLYALVRITLLALAFAALRSVPEGVYATTWTRFLPNIS